MAALPNFIIIGAGKSGTTTLDAMLSTHPQIYMSPLKEPCFFCKDELHPKVNKSATRNFGDYCRLFDGVEKEAAIGEVSPQYLSKPGTARRIADAIPDVKLIAIFRNPVERAYSLFMHLRRDGIERFADFREALTRSELKDLYIEEGRYGSAIEDYLLHFPRERMHLVLYEDLCDSPLKVAEGIFSFLGVDAKFQPQVTFKRNVSGVPRSLALKMMLRTIGEPRRRAWLRSILPFKWKHRAVAILHKWMSKDLVRSPMSYEDRLFLAGVFNQDIARLSRVLDRDLSHWTTL